MMQCNSLRNKKYDFKSFNEPLKVKLNFKGNTLTQNEHE